MRVLTVQRSELNGGDSSYIGVNDLDSSAIVKGEGKDSPGGVVCESPR